MTEAPLFPWWKAVTLDEMRHGIYVIEASAEYNASADNEHQMGMQSILMAISPTGPSHNHDKAMAMAAS